MKNVLVETAYNTFTIVEDKTRDTGHTVIRGKIGEVDTKNRNGRVYPRAIMEREIPKLLAESNRSYRLGTIDHPKVSPALSDLALKWTDLQIQGNDVIGEAQIIPTQKGKDLEQLVRAGIEVGMSSRGNGEFRSGQWNGTEALIVNDTYELITFDSVVNPSVAEAHVAALEQYGNALGKVDTLLESDPDIVNKIIEKLMEENELQEDTWTAAEQNDLPDSSFLYIEKGGKKDTDGKTTPRSLRHLPYKDAKGNVDLPHLRNALARIPNATFLTAAQKKSLTKRAQRILNNATKAAEEFDNTNIVSESKWDATYLADLPDSHFLYVPENVELDSLGNVPTVERYWPYIDAEGETDLTMLQKALDEIPNTGLPIELQQTLVAKAQSLLNAISLTAVGGDKEGITTVDQHLKDAKTLRTIPGEATGESVEETPVTTNESENTEESTDTSEETTTTEDTELTTLKEGLASKEAELTESKAQLIALTEQKAAIITEARKIAEGYASLGNLLNALKVALVAELGDNDWDDAEWIADFGRDASWRQAADAIDALGEYDVTPDSADGDVSVENLNNRIDVIESLKDFIPEFVTTTRENKVKAYIAEKTAEEAKFSIAIAKALQEAAPKSTTAVDEMYETVKASVEAKMNATPGVATAGTVENNNAPRWTAAQLQQRRLAGLEPLF